MRLVACLRHNIFFYLLRVVRRINFQINGQIILVSRLQQAGVYVYSLKKQPFQHVFVIPAYSNTWVLRAWSAMLSRGIGLIIKSFLTDRCGVLCLFPLRASLNFRKTNYQLRWDRKLINAWIDETVRCQRSACHHALHCISVCFAAGSVSSTGFHDLPLACDDQFNLHPNVYLRMMSYIIHTQTQSEYWHHSVRLPLDAS